LTSNGEAWEYARGIITIDHFKIAVTVYTQRRIVRVLVAGTEIEILEDNSR